MHVYGSASILLSSRSAEAEFTWLTGFDGEWGEDAVRTSAQIYRRMRPDTMTPSERVTWETVGKNLFVSVGATYLTQKTDPRPHQNLDAVSAAYGARLPLL